MIKLLLILLTHLIALTPKVMLKASFLAASSACAQPGNFFFGTNTSDLSAGIWESNSPGSTHGNRRYQVLLDKNITHWYCRRLVYDSIGISNSAVTSPSFPFFTSSGEMKVCKADSMVKYFNSSLTIPYAHITGAPSSVTQTLSGSGTKTLNLSGGGGVFIIPSQTIQPVALSLSGQSLTAGANTIVIPTQTIGIISNVTPTITGITGISIVTSGESYSITNIAPDKTITIISTNTLVSIGSSYPGFTIGLNLLADYTNTATTTSGTATFYLTDTKMSTGNALYSNITYVNPVVNDLAANYIYSWTISVDKKTLTLNSKSASPTGVIALLGISVLGAPINVTNGTVISILVKGN